MSGRSVNALNDKVRKLNLPAGSCFRRYKYINGGHSEYMPPKPLGWFFRTVDGAGNYLKEYYLGEDMNEAMAHLDNWSKEHGKEGAAA